MRARYYKGEHMGKSWGGPWATATITVAGEPAETPTPEPVKEEPVQQPARDDPNPPAGTIETLTATDDDAGQLVLSWTAPAAPNADPTDYHVNWAKSTEDYPADTADSGNTHPDSTTHTMAGLEYGTEYNIRVRSRYTDGDHAASPWNGPWTETTAQVKLPLPAAPSFINTAATEGQVLLSWFNPSDDSITGYQILRGPDAGNLVVIEDDTESNSTSYTDTAPPAGQTHTYGVKARNAAGLSPAGTATATVPAVEEEEKLVTARHEDGGSTLVSNLGQTFSSEGAIAGTYLGSYKEHAIAFTTGANPLGYHVTTAQLTVKEFPGEGTPNPDLSIRADDGGVPGETVIYTLTATSAVTDSWNLLTFATTDNFTLRPNTTYWLYATTMGTIPMFIRGTESEAEDAESNTDWRIGDARYFRADGGTWTQSVRMDDFNLGINISGHPAPAFLVSNLDSPSEDVVFSRRTAADGAKLAQAFSAADNTNGTAAEFDFHGITVLLQSQFSNPNQLADSDILVTVHSDTGDQPGDLVHTLTSPETYTVHPVAGPTTFSAPPGSTLSSGITYWVKFEIATASTFFTGLNSIYFELATDNNDVQGPTTYNRWSIGHDSLWSPETLAWTHEVKSIEMSVLGSQRFDTLVSNIGQPSFIGNHQSASIGLKAAQSFHTPSGPLGQQYRFNSVHIIASSQNPTRATVDLHADDNGAPGDHLARFTTPGDFAPGLSAKDDFIGAAPRNTLLNTDTRYWIIFSNPENLTNFRIGLTRSETEDLTSLDGWTIGDSRVKKVPNQPWDELYDPIQMELLGTPFIRTDEADGPDLPGAGHNAHKSGAVVIPGTVSTGHLTAGLDYNHGHSGDYWWLNTQRGHSYRIEVTFGGSTSNDTGGSAWAYFIDGDRRGSCCESDHNRNDGYTFIHINHDQNRKYLINVATFDKLNTGSQTFNGSYTITMTDITGTEKVATNLYMGTRAEANNFAGSSRKYAVDFTTGQNPAGYKLDRIRTHIPLSSSHPNLALHANTSSAPGAELCSFRNPTQVQHHLPPADNPAPIPFLAPDCADVTLIAGTKYWIVFAGNGYKPVLTDSDDQLTNRSGWLIGNVAATKTASTWSNLADGPTIPVEIWASKR